MKAGRVDRDARPAATFEPSALSRQLSDFEFTLIILTFGFSRWVEKCMEAAGVRGLSAQDILVLHSVNHRARDRRVSDICMVLNIDDPHLVTYALKKLQAADLVETTAIGRERHYRTTAAGDAACLAYRHVREEFLVPSLSWIAEGRDVVPDVAAFLRTMTALYDQAGRFALAASPATPVPPLRTKPARRSRRARSPAT
ncbi:MAG: winged helix DNA-binding protein [Alphaproteobacteria bacterium]|nr:winged helix DNA-binding protein [Alphaproteobacteria bacterium]